MDWPQQRLGISNRRELKTITQKWSEPSAYIIKKETLPQSSSQHYFCQEPCHEFEIATKITLKFTRKLQFLSVRVQQIRRPKWSHLLLMKSYSYWQLENPKKIQRWIMLLWIFCRRKFAILSVLRKIQKLHNLTRKKKKMVLLHRVYDYSLHQKKSPYHTIEKQNSGLGTINATHL